MPYLVSLYLEPYVVPLPYLVNLYLEPYVAPMSYLVSLYLVPYVVPMPYLVSPADLFAASIPNSPIMDHQCIKSAMYHYRFSKVIG